MDQNVIVEWAHLSAKKWCLALFFLISAGVITPCFGEPEPPTRSRQMPGEASLSPTGKELLERARSENADEYSFAIKEGAEVRLTKDGKTFYVFWKPENYDEAMTPVVVSLHGHGSWTLRDFYMWLPYIKERGYAILTLQWWKGTGEQSRDYLTPSEVYREIDMTLKDLGIRSPALLHGFSRGSAILYAVAAMDVYSGRRYFDLFIANSGKAVPDYPPNKNIQNNRFGNTPFQGTRWVTVAGGKDKEGAKFPSMGPGNARAENSNAIDGMRLSGKWIESLGGEIVLAIEDPSAGHDVFHRHPENVKQALDAFDRIVSAAAGEAK